MTAAPTSFAIIGGGFSGSLLAVHLLRRLPSHGRVTLIEKRSEFGSGVAYSTANASHLLNVRAERMSAFEHDPEHFQRWLGQQSDVPCQDGGAFVPRGLFGRYVQALLAEQLWTEGGNRNLFLFPDEATSLALDQSGISIGLSGGRPLRVDAAILAVGNFPPQVPAGAEALLNSNRYQADPWNVAATAAIPTDATVLVIGTGLTMVDFVLNLLDRGHRGRILAVSRRGLLPHRHAASPPPLLWPADPRGLTVSQRLRQVRLAARRNDWRAVFDGLRPQTQSWWAALSMVEQRRFLRHLRPWWDIHRHRMAPAVADRIGAALGSGSLTLLAGKFGAIEAGPQTVSLRFRLRGGESEGTLRVDHVVNCSGPASDYARIEQGLIRDLLDQGVITPDPLGLGLAVDDSLRLLDRRGVAQQRLYAVGPLTRGRFWECTAVPEIRRQTEELAARLTGPA